MYHLAGLDTAERVFSPVSRSVRLRVPWLLINLLTALLAALTVLVGVQLLQLPTQGFLVFTLILVVAWLAIGWDLVRQYRRLTLAKTGSGRT